MRYSIKKTRNSGKNSGNGNLLHGKWQEQRDSFYLEYCAFYELLDELTLKGYNPRQIREALETGIKSI